MGGEEVRCQIYLSIKSNSWYVQLAETEGFEPSIGLYNPITV
jgi:hypothetical protein